MDDVIRRQAAIDAIYHHFPQMSKVAARMILHEVPSEEPKKGNEKCSNKLPCGWCSLFDSPCLVEEPQKGAKK